MHETSQRKICRVAFLALCVLPTIGLAGSVGWRLWPGRHDAVLASLGRQLGGRLTAERITTPKPGLCRVEGLTLADPETAAPIAGIDWIEFQGGLQSGDHNASRGGTLSVPDPVAAAHTLDRLLRSDWPNNGRLTLKKISLGKQKNASWQDASVVLSTAEGKANRRRQLTVSQRSGTAGLGIERHQNGPTPRSVVQLNTGNQAVSWAWIASLGDRSNRGPDETDQPTFRGSIEATQTVDHATLSGTGALTNVQPATLLGNNGLLLTAPMTIALDQLQISDGRVVNLQAECEAGPGVIEHNLVLAAIKHLGCQATTPLQRIWPRQTDRGPFEPIPFDRLAFSVSIDTSGCRIAGDSLLASSAGPLLLAPLAPAPVDALLHLAAPMAERYHPAAPAARKLANRLPLAPIK